MPIPPFGSPPSPWKNVNSVRLWAGTKLQADLGSKTTIFDSFIGSGGYFPNSAGYFAYAQGNEAYLILERANNSVMGLSNIIMGANYNGTQASKTASAEGDVLLEILGSGYDGTQLGAFTGQAATMGAIVTGSVSAGVIPTTWDIFATDQINLVATNNVLINNTWTLPNGAGTNGYVLTTNGSNAASWAPAGGGSSLWVAAAAPNRMWGSTYVQAYLGSETSILDPFFTSSDSVFAAVSDAAPTIMILETAIDGTGQDTASTLFFQGYNGSVASPTTSVSGDTIFTIVGSGYDGTNPGAVIGQQAYIVGQVTGAVSTGVIPTSLYMSASDEIELTAQNDMSLTATTSDMNITSGGTVTITSGTSGDIILVSGASGNIDLNPGSGNLGVKALILVKRTSTSVDHNIVFVTGTVNQFEQGLDIGSNDYVVFNDILLTNALRINVGTNALTLNGAYTLPVSDGTANYFLQTDGSGNVSWAAGGGGSTPVVSTKTANYNVASADNQGLVMLDTTSNTVAATLSTTVSSGYYVTVKWIAGTNAATVNPNGRTIDGSGSTLTLGQLNDSITVYYDGTNYWRT